MASDSIISTLTYYYTDNAESVRRKNMNSRTVADKCGFCTLKSSAAIPLIADSNETDVFIVTCVLNGNTDGWKPCRLVMFFKKGDGFATFVHNSCSAYPINEIDEMAATLQGSLKSKTKTSVVRTDKQLQSIFNLTPSMMTQLVSCGVKAGSYEVLYVGLPRCEAADSE